MAKRRSHFPTFSSLQRHGILTGALRDIGGILVSGNISCANNTFVDILQKQSLTIGASNINSIRIICIGGFIFAIYDYYRVLH